VAREKEISVKINLRKYFHHSHRFTSYMTATQYMTDYFDGLPTCTRITIIFKQLQISKLQLQKPHVDYGILVASRNEGLKFKLN